MAEQKTKPTGVSVDRFLKDVPDEQRRADARQLLTLLREVTGEKPTMWGPTMVGFGKYHYVYDAGHEGDTFLTGFSPRKDALVLYFFAGLEDRLAGQLARLGKHKVGKGCLYLKKLADVDLAVLRQMIEANLAFLADWAKKQAEKHGAQKKPTAKKKASAKKSAGKKPPKKTPARK